MTKDMTFSALRTAALTALITLCATPGAALALVVDRSTGKIVSRKFDD